MFITAQVVVDAFAERSGAFAVNDTYAWHMCKISVVQIFIELSNGFVYGFSKQVQFHAYGSRF